MKIISPLLAAILFLLVSTNTSAKPKLLATIKPLALIAGDLVGDLVEVEILLPPSVSPHHYAMSISDRRRLGQADLIVWMGSDLERFLSKPLDRIDDSKKLSVANSEDLTGRENHTGASDPNHTDPHQWLNPLRAIVIAEAIAERIMASFPELRGQILERLRQQRQAYAELDQALEQKLAPYRYASFIADHNAYAEVAAAFSLRQLAFVFQQADQAPGARHLANLDAVIDAEQPRCLLLEYGQQSPALKRWAERWRLKTVTIDILGVQPSIHSYRELMSSVAISLEICLSQA